MNVKEMTERVEAELRWAPNIQVHRTNVKDVLTDCYRELAEAYAWPWMRRTHPLWVFPDLTIANADLTRVSARSFEVATGALETAGLYAAEDAGVSGEWKRYLAGAVLDLADATLRDQGDGNWPIAPFEIENAEDSATGGQDTILFLDPRASITSLTGNEGSFVIKFPRVQLPVDCANVVEIRASDKRLVPPVSYRDGLALAERSGSSPSLWWADTGLDLRTAEWRFPIGKLTPAAPVARSVSAYGLRNDAIFDDPPLTVQGAAGNLPSKTYEVFLAWWWAGRLSPASRKVRTRVTTGGIEITSALPAMPDTSYGRRLTVWFGPEGGPYYLHAMLTTATTTTVADITDLPAQQLYQTVRWDEAHPGGDYKYIRLYPRPATVERFEVTYIPILRPLRDETDEPEFDSSFHDVLVWQATERLAAQSNATKRASTARTIANDRYRALRRRYGMHEAARTVRRGFDEEAWPVILQPPSINWQGE